MSVISEKTILLSSHGNLMGILLYNFDSSLIMKNEADDFSRLFSNW